MCSMHVMMRQECRTIVSLASTCGEEDLRIARWRVIWCVVCEVEGNLVCGLRGGG